MAGAIRSFRDLVAWQRAFALGMAIYKATESFPDRERFGLTVQARRSAVSVASNIAEGYGRGTTSDYLRFLRVARGSVYELDTQMAFAVELGFLERSVYEEVKSAIDESERVLAGLIRSIPTGQDA